jgi:hypothetical protein
MHGQQNIKSYLVFVNIKFSMETLPSGMLSHVDWLTVIVEIMGHK